MLTLILPYENISLFFCMCNVSKYCFLFVWKANKVKVREKVLFMNDFHLCTHLYRLDLHECHTGSASDFGSKKNGGSNSTVCKKF